MTDEAKNDTAEKANESPNLPIQYEGGSTIPFDVKTGSMQIRTVGDLIFLCKIFAKTNMVPDCYKRKPDAIFVAATTGFRVGFTDILMALQSIAVVNGNPSIYGKGALGLIKRSNKLTSHVEVFQLADGTQVDHYNGPADLSEWDDGITAICEMTRENGKPARGMFSVADAKRMGKWNKPTDKGYNTVWMNHPCDMLMWRARHKVFDKDWSDVMCGLLPYEIAIDMEPIDSDGGVTYVPKGDTYVQEGEVSMSDEQPEKVNTPHPFDEMFKADQFPEMDTFIDLVATNSEQSVEQTKDEAMQSHAAFEETYHKWYAQAFPEGPKKEPEGEEESPFQDPETDPNEIQENGNNKDYNPEEKQSLDPQLIVQKFFSNRYEGRAEEFEPAFERYLSYLINDLKHTVQTVADGMVKNEPGFFEAFESWKDTLDLNDQEKEGPESSKEKAKVPEEKTDEVSDFYAQPEQGLSKFRQEWNLKTKKNFSAYVFEDVSKWERARIEAPKDYKRGKEKFEKFYPDKVWPVSTGSVSIADDTTVKPVQPGMRHLFTDSDDLTPEDKHAKMLHWYPKELEQSLGELKFKDDNLGPGAVNVLEFRICDILKARLKGGDNATAKI